MVIVSDDSNMSNAGGTLGADQGLNGAAYSEILWDGTEGTDGEVDRTTDACPPP